MPRFIYEKDLGPDTATLKRSSATILGYYFKVLKGQGPAAPFGQLDYVIDGAMIGGFALMAFPAEYRVTGVKSS